MYYIVHILVCNHSKVSGVVCTFKVIHSRDLLAVSLRVKKWKERGKVRSIYESRRDNGKKGAFDGTKKA